jgi:hypothetical protein
VKKLKFKNITFASRRKIHLEEGVPPKKRRGRFWRRLGRTLIIFIGFVVILLMVAPRIALWNMNQRLANMPEYYAHVGDLDIDYWNLTAVAHDVVIKKKNGKIDVPLIYVSKSTVKLDEDADNAGIKATSIVVDSIAINMVSSYSKELSQMPTDSAFMDVLHVLMPLERNKLVIKTGHVNYYDNKHSPNTVIELSNLQIKGDNLMNIKDSASATPGRLNMTANVYGALLTANIKVNTKSKTPLFDVSATLTKLNLVNVNHLLKAYAKFDVHKGYFSMSTEMATKDNHIRGYVKPVIDDLDIFDRKSEKGESTKTKQRERWIDFGAWLFKNKKEDKISTRIEIDGMLNNPNINIWQIIGEAITESTTKSLFGGLDNSVGINSVGTVHKKNFLEKVFDKKDKKEKPKKEKNKKKK